MTEARQGAAAAAAAAALMCQVGGLHCVQQDEELYGRVCVCTCERVLPLVLAGAAGAAQLGMSRKQEQVVCWWCAGLSPRVRYQVLVASLGV